MKITNIRQITFWGKFEILMKIKHCLNKLLNSILLQFFIFNIYLKYFSTLTFFSIFQYLRKEDLQFPADNSKNPWIKFCDREPVMDGKLNLVLSSTDL